MTRKEARAIIGNQPKWAVRNMRRALEMMTYRNTPDDWKRLEACYTLAGTPHSKRVTP